MQRRVLIVKLGALGDAVMASTMINSIKGVEYSAECNTVHITWLCGDDVRQLIGCFDGVDEIISFDNSGLSKGIFSKVKAVLSAWKLLMGYKFDEVYLAHTDKRYRVLILPIRAKVKRVFAGRLGVIPGRYGGIDYARLPFGADDYIDKFHPVARLKEGVVSKEVSKELVILQPGGAKNLMMESSLRRWPLGHYVALAERLLEFGSRVAIVGSKADGWVEEAFEKIEVGGKRVESYIGKLTVPELINFISSAGCMVCHDSGPVHIAMLTEVDLVALFGPVNREDRLFGKALERSIGGKTVCSPCYDGRLYASCTSNRCMQLITVDEVFEKIMEIYL